MCARSTQQVTARGAAHVGLALGVRVCAERGGEGEHGVFLPELLGAGAVGGIARNDPGAFLTLLAIITR